MAKKQNTCELLKQLRKDPGNKSIIEAIKKFPTKKLSIHADNCDACSANFAGLMTKVLVGWVKGKKFDDELHALMDEFMGKS